MVTTLWCGKAYGQLTEPDPHVQFNGTVRALAWSDTAWKPTDDAPKGGQVAEFTVSAASYHAPPGFGITGYQWQDIRQSGVLLPPGHLLIEGTGTNQIATAHAYGPGKFRAICVVQLEEHSSGQPYVAAIEGHCAVIGGPITIGITSGNVPTFKNDGGDTSKSFFLEYFAYPHAQPAPAGFQRTQDASAAMATQPDGAVITCTKPTHCYSATLITTPHAVLIDLAADASFQDEVLSAAVHIDFTDDDGIVTAGDAQDDTTSTPTVDPRTHVKHMMVDTFSGHEPGALTRTAADITNVISGSGVAGADYRYQLNDTAGAPFPGVWIQERFVPNDPPEQGFRTNKSEKTDPWTPRLTDGYFNSPDHFSYSWPLDHNDRHWVHHYWAATRSYTTGGIDMGAYTLNFLYGPPSTFTQNP